jgi:hypothetical protein
VIFGSVLSSLLLCLEMPLQNALAGVCLLHDVLGIGQRWAQTVEN